MRTYLRAGLHGINQSVFEGNEKIAERPSSDFVSLGYDLSFGVLCQGQSVLSSEDGRRDSGDHLSFNRQESSINVNYSST